MLQGDENQQSLLNFIDSSMKVPERKLILEVFIPLLNSIDNLILYIAVWIKFLAYGHNTIAATGFELGTSLFQIQQITTVP